jgi:hypothetical protein
VADWLERVAALWRAHQEVSVAVAMLSLVSLAVGLVATPRFLARMPSDYFLRRHQPLERLRDAHPIVRGLVLGLKNAFAVLLLLAGVLMLFLPGQGLLTLLVAVLLLDVPGKQRVALWFVRRRVLLAAIQWIRKRAAQPPLELP